MAEAYRVCVAVVTALALCKYSGAEWNATDGPANRTVSCHHHGNSNNCTDIKDTEEEWSGHFSVCPRELKHYCIHGTCRYVKEQEAPSCRCEHGFAGSRCEYVDMGSQIGEQRKIIISVIAGLVLLVILVGVIFLCAHRKKRSTKRKSPGEEPTTSPEKITLTKDSSEIPHTDAVCESVCMF